MAVVAVLNQKGGVGKTTLVTNLTRALHLEGAKVLLVDSDPQGSARDWHAAGDGQPRAAMVVSRRVRGTKLGDEIRDALASYDLPVFETDTTQRVIYANSATTGTTVLDAEPNGPAAEEIRALTQELKEFANGTRRRQAQSKATA